LFPTIQAASSVEVASRAQPSSFTMNGWIASSVGLYIRNNNIINRSQTWLGKHMKTVAIFYKLSDASFAQSLLMGDGIAAELQNVESSVNLVGGLPSIQVLVHETDFDRALMAVQPLINAKPSPPKSMKISETEYFVFKAIVKGIGVYQLIAGLGDFAGVVIDAAGVRHLPVGSVSRGGEYVVWGIYHFIVAMVLLYGTDLFCRLAFPQPIFGAQTEEKPSQSPDPMHAPAKLSAGQGPRQD
jgi:hypothetical protein